MRNTKKIKFFSILLAVTLLLTALPLYSALAADETTPEPEATATPTPTPATATPEPGDGHIILLQEVSDEEKGYLQTESAYAGESITFYVPILNKNLESATGLSCAFFSATPQNPFGTAPVCTRLKLGIPSTAS
ncbi:MAG: hypothetical protein R2881_09615 [Eubacteriales bacterium]